jgi:preprotein translocase subunit SecF
MIEIFGDIQIDWLSKRRLFYGISAVLLLVGLVSVLAKGSLRYGVDFQGGAVVYVRFADPVPVDQIRDLLRNSGAPDSQIQELAGSDDSGYDVLIQVEQSIVEDDLSAGRELITAALNDSFEGRFEILNSESVGPKVGADLRRQAVFATLYALGGILVFIAFRFEWVYGAAAVFAVFHDTLITLGFFSIFNKEINLTVIAALLTLVGYSVNDTIVVFDRVRENLRLSRRSTLENVLNRSINQTLSRTVLTSGLTLVAGLAMYFFGGEVINNFAFALVVGVLVGTYSSIAVASPTVLVFINRRERAKARGPALAKMPREARTK